MNQRVWIYCRVLFQSHKELLDFQSVRLTEFARKRQMKIIGCTKEIDTGQNFQRYSITQLLPYIKTKRIDMILIENKVNLFSDDNLFYEFSLLCDYYHVKIIETKSS